MFRSIPLALAPLALAALPACAAQGSAPAALDRPGAADPLAFADLADLALAAPIALEGTVTGASRTRDPVAPAGQVSAYVELDIGAVIRAPAPLGARQGYLWQGTDRQRRALSGARVLVFARPLPGRPGLLQLVAPDAQLAWTPERSATVRALLADAAKPDAPPAITGVTRAFTVPGQVAGERQTQIFLATEAGAPVSLSVLRAPGRPPSWRLALGDVVGAAAAAPRPDTLVWYRLACGLPPELPAAALPDDPVLAAAARADYRFVRDALGPCGRTRG